MDIDSFELVCMLYISVRINRTCRKVMGNLGCDSVVTHKRKFSLMWSARRSGPWAPPRNPATDGSSVAAPSRPDASSGSWDVGPEPPDPDPSRSYGNLQQKYICQAGVVLGMNQKYAWFWIELAQSEVKYRGFILQKWFAMTPDMGVQWIPHVKVHSYVTFAFTFFFIFNP